MGRPASSAPLSEWSQPLPLPSGLLPVPLLDPMLLPSHLRAWAVDIAERQQVPLEFVAIPVLVAASTLIGRRVGIRPERNGDWKEVANLWGCVVGSPGTLKSPAMREALSPIYAREREACVRNEEAKADYAIDEALAKLEREVAEREARSLLKTKDNIDPREAARAAFKRSKPLKRPREERYVANDVTAEKLGEICADNPSGILAHRDELLTLLAELDHPEKVTARGFYLTGWSGRDGYTFDRIQRGTVRVEAVNLALIGTAQPDRIVSYGRRAIEQHGDGMLQRLQLMAWPDILPDWCLVDRVPAAAAAELARATFDNLAELAANAINDVGAEQDSDGVPYLRFSQMGQRVFDDWRVQHERRVRGEGQHPAFISHISKYRGLVPRLALIHHMTSGLVGPVSEESARVAILLAEYLEAHAQRLYHAALVGAFDAPRTLWRRVESGDLTTPFTARDVKQKDWSGLDNARVDTALAMLTQHHWLRAEHVETGGRPRTSYRINPYALSSSRGLPARKPGGSDTVKTFKRPHEVASEGFEGADAAAPGPVLA